MDSAQPPDPRSVEKTRGTFAAIAAFGIWGIVPLYFKQMIVVTPLEVLSHRVLWGFSVMLPLAIGSRGLKNFQMAVPQALRTRQLWVSTAAIAGNWLIYFWAIQIGRVVETSLGYFINPLINVLFGVLFFRERLSRAQLIAVVLSAIAVLNLALRHAHPPWIALFLAGSFGLYGSLRKSAKVDPLIGCVVEFGLLVPIALVAAVWLHASGHSHFLQLPGWLMSTGIVTSLPLLLFIYAARRLPLSSIGLVQYISPTGQFIVAVWAFGEKISATYLLSFALIWTGLILVTFEPFLRRRW